MRASFSSPISLPARLVYIFRSKISRSLSSFFFFTPLISLFPPLFAFVIPLNTKGEGKRQVRSPGRTRGGDSCLLSLTFAVLSPSTTRKEQVCSRSTRGGRDTNQGYLPCLFLKDGKKRGKEEDGISCSIREKKERVCVCRHSSNRQEDDQKKT